MLATELRSTQRHAPENVIMLNGRLVSVAVQSGADKRAMSLICPSTAW